MNLDTITCADIFDLCATVPNSAVDMILCDLPYGTTACSWDTVIPFEPMWKAFKRIIKPRGAIVLTASQPFTSALVMSNSAMFKYSLVWVKTMASGYVHARNKPLKTHEDVLVFSEGTSVHEGQSDCRMAYYPQIRSGKPYKKTVRTPNVSLLHSPSTVNLGYIGITNRNAGTRYPISVLEFSNPNYASLHPTQKPVALFEHLIKTYTQPGELVFDPCVGSGTTAIAARKSGRHFVCGDSSPEYVKIAQGRLQNTDPFQDRQVAPNVVQHSLFSQLEAMG